MYLKKGTAVNLDFTNFCVTYTSPKTSTNAEGCEKYFLHYNKNHTV
jgi:hypothetical protein